MHDHGLGSWLPRRRLKTPRRRALVAGDRTIDYAALAAMADTVAGALSRRGIGNGDRVAFLGENSPEFIATLFGVAQLGAVFVPINTRLAPPEIDHVLRDSGARALLHDLEFAARIDASEAVPVHRIPTDELAADADDAAASGGHFDARVVLDDPAAIIYTSGTTGRAKGAVLTHGNLTWVAMNALVDFDVVSTDVALMISPLFHVASLGMGALPVLLKGGTIVLEKSFDAGRALSLIQRQHVTMLSGVPTTFQLLADDPAWPTTDLSSLDKLTCGGSPVPTRVMNAYELRGLAFSQGYGMTEASPGVTNLPPQFTRVKQGSVGLPHFFTDVRITDDMGGMVSRGTVGEVQVSGPNVFLGYHDLPETTAAAFTADGWFRSGDLGFLDADGFLYITDRLKDLIISGGENIYPAEVENLLFDIDGVTGAAVIGVPDDRWGEVPWAVVTVSEGAQVDTESVRDHLAERIARYKLPVRVVVVDALPRTASGKVRKADLRERAGEGTL